MPIDLGLSRITRLLQHLGNPHINAYKSIHVAGTNGKGSTVAYLSSVLTQSKIRNGRFVSPHMIYYNDCICINNEVYPLSKFKLVSELVQKENASLQLGCTEFELLTVTAFKIFELERVELAIIEVGLGGRLDATNVLQPYNFRDRDTRGGVIATAITKIGIDHEALLGNTLTAIAHEKVGIMKNFIPCVVDRTNDNEVLDVVKERAKETSSDLYLVDGIKESTSEPSGLLPNRSDPNIVKSLLKFSPLKGNYQLQNLSVALKILDIIGIQDHKLFKDENNTPKITPELISLGIRKTDWPGRLQSVKIPKNGLSVLLDGAHNESAAIELGKYLQIFRLNKKGIIFIIGLTKGKSIDDLLRHITNKLDDSIIPTVFTPPDHMPWISSYGHDDIRRVAKNYVQDVKNIGESSQSIEKVLDYANELKLKGDEREVVVCGSLYLCADVLRQIEKKKVE